MDISLEMNLDLVQIARQGYTFLDVLSDVGGLQGLLLSFCMGLLVLWNYNNFDNYLASRLYKIEDDSFGSFSSDHKKSSFLRPTICCNWYEYLLDIPCCSRCCKKCKCRKTEQMKSIEKARIQMSKEINIVEIIKSRRYVQMALRLLLSK